MAAVCRCPVKFDSKQIDIGFGDLEIVLRELSTVDTAMQQQETFDKPKTDVAVIELRPCDVIVHRTMDERKSHAQDVFEVPTHGLTIRAAPAAMGI